jgi:hypothetical protein
MSDAITGKLTEDGVMIDDATGHPVVWRRGDESTETAELHGTTIEAETPEDYKGVSKPGEFATWSLPERRAWREGVDACLSRMAEEVTRQHVASLLRTLIEEG